MRISDWSSDVCSSDLLADLPHCLLDPGAGAAIDDNGGARACQSFCCGAADAGGGTGNDGLTAGQIDDHAVLSRILVVRFDMGLFHFDAIGPRTIRSRAPRPAGARFCQSKWTRTLKIKTRRTEHKAGM